MLQKSWVKLRTKKKTATRPDSVPCLCRMLSWLPPWVPCIASSCLSVPQECRSPASGIQEHRPPLTCPIRLSSFGRNAALSPLHHPQIKHALVYNIKPRPEYKLREIHPIHHQTHTNYIYRFVEAKHKIWVFKQSMYVLKLRIFFFYKAAYHHTTMYLIWGVHVLLMLKMLKSAKHNKQYRKQEKFVLTWLWKIKN